jgi:Zn-dependent protease with chaperone function
MDDKTFEAMVSRLEAESTARPREYKLRVAGLALLGFGILGLLLGSVGLGLLVLVGLVLAVVFSGGAALLWLLKLSKLVMLLAVPMYYLVKQGVQALFVRLPAPAGTRLTRAQAPALFQALDGMRQQLRGPRVHEVLLVDEVNAAVVQRPAFGLVGFPRNYVLLGLPLLEGLPPEEALAVVAHEYGHLAGSHGRFGAWIYRLRHTWGTLQAQTEQMQGWMAALVRPLVRWYAPYFNAYTFVLARANEYEADAASAELVGAQAAASALKRVNLVAPRYEAFLGRTFDSLREHARPPADLGQRWAEHTRRPAADDEAQRWLAAALQRRGGVADTHPALRERLSALPGQAAQLERLPPVPDGPSAAEAWLGAALPALREQLQRAWAERVAPAWGERHEEMQRDLQRLAQLRALPAPTLDEDYERLRLQTRLEVEVDQREAWAAFNAAHPGHAGGLFFEGAERLFHDDEAGLALLAQAMALDAELTQAACARQHAYLQKHGREAEAAEVAARWQARGAFEAQREAEASSFDPKHTLVAPDAELLAAVRALLPRQAPDFVGELYLARRVLPSDPSVVSCVLGVRLTWWGRRRGKQQAVLDQLAATAWPVPLFVCSLDGHLASLRERLRALPDSRVF